MMDFAAMGINLLVSWVTGRSLDSTLGGLESRIRNPRKALEKAVKKICTKYGIDEESLKEKDTNELRPLLEEEQWIELSLEFLNELSKSDREKKLFEILIENRINLENVKNEIEELNLGSLEAMMRFSTTAFSFSELPTEEELRDELGPFELTYIKRETIRIDDLKKKEKVVFAGKCGSGKSRLLFEILKGRENIAFLKSFFKENDVMSLGMVVQPLTDFIIVWDNLHMVKEEEIQQCLQRINAVCQEKGVNLRFFGASRKEKVRYGLSIEEISLPDMRKKQLVDVCSKLYGKEIDRKAAETLLSVGDGTPEYILSFFKTFRKKVVTEEDLEDCPADVVKFWAEYIKDMNVKGSAVEKALRSVALSSRGFERVVLEYVENLYSSVFYGDLSRFDDSMIALQEMFFIEKRGEERYSFHDSRAEAVEREFPLEMRHVNRLVAVVLKLPEEVRRYVLRNYADWSFFAERYEICVRFSDFMIEIDPKLAQAYNNRGLAYRELNRYERAIEDFDKALEIDPKLAQAYKNFMVTYKNFMVT
ncbi:MAG: tetratricopeptide repeat protein [Theionarchaea archaeon]|nr:tetratricopeptide repeat protein [Theionarchaea archaeon]